MCVYVYVRVWVCLCVIFHCMLVTCDLRNADLRSDNSSNVNDWTMDYLSGNAGARRLSEDIRDMTGSSPNMFFIVCWYFVSPILIFVSIDNWFSHTLYFLCTTVWQWMLLLVVVDSKIFSFPFFGLCACVRACVRVCVCVSVCICLFIWGDGGVGEGGGGEV